MSTFRFCSNKPPGGNPSHPGTCQSMICQLVQTCSSSAPRATSRMILSAVCANTIWASCSSARSFQINSSFWIESTTRAPSNNARPRHATQHGCFVCSCAPGRARLCVLHRSPATLGVQLPTTRRRGLGLYSLLGVNPPEQSRRALRHARQSLVPASLLPRDALDPVMGVPNSPAVAR